MAWLTNSELEEMWDAAVAFQLEVLSNTILVIVRTSLVLAAPVSRRLKRVLVSCEEVILLLL